MACSVSTETHHAALAAGSARVQGAGGHWPRAAGAALPGGFRGEEDC